MPEKAFYVCIKDSVFIDPACGSGNFLTETYLSLRRIENEIIKILNKSQTTMGFEGTKLSPIKVSINQFYGIEINDFAVSVAKTALWIAEAQMFEETKHIVISNIDFFPLKTYTNIVEGNALRMDWNNVISKEKTNYIMGNPPFVGKKYQTKMQKDDIKLIANSIKGYGDLDYVTMWHIKAADYINETNIRCALVSTNSICQGEQPSIIWKYLFSLGIIINFAYKTFRWDSEANIKAHVHCIIVGFSFRNNDDKYIFEANGTKKIVNNINGYLNDGPNVFVESRSKPICNVSPMTAGNKPVDYNFLKIEPSEYLIFKSREPQSLKYIKKMVGAEEFINKKDRYCLWLVDCSPSELRSMPMVMDRVRKCREARLASIDEGARKLADTPTLFRETKNPKQYIVIPAVSSEKRQYIPIGYLDDNTIPVMGVLIIPDASLFEFGILTSRVHMVWMRLVAGRLEMRYRYSKDIVYNNFPWPKSNRNKEKIAETAEEILKARSLYPEASLADLYDEISMPIELRKAHQLNDKAVMEAYGFNNDMSETEIASKLMELYKKMTN